MSQTRSGDRRFFLTPSWTNLIPSLIHVYLSSGASHSTETL